MGLVTPETVQPVLDDWSAYRALPEDARPPLAASAAAWEGLDGTRLAAWADAGKLRPTVSATFAFDEAGVRGAFEALRSRRTAGKVVLDVSSA